MAAKAEDTNHMIVVPIQVDPEDSEDSRDVENDQEYDVENFPEETFVQKMNRAAIIMRDGNEIQRISIVRNLPTLMNEDPDECLIKLIPVVQDVLCGTGNSSAGLELHVEASQAYRDIILVQHQRLQNAESKDGDESRNMENNASCAPYTIDLGLCSQILKGIVQNLEAQDSIACSAWLETLLEVVDHLPLCLIRSRVLPMAVQKAQQLNSIHARLTATKLFGHLTTKLEPNEVKSEIVPLVQALCQDSDAGVRASVCQQLPVVTRCMQVPELNSTVLPLIIEFSKDEDEAVREANLETLATLIDAFDEETCTEILVPVVKKFVDDTLRTTRARSGKEAGSGSEEKENEEKSRHSVCTEKSISALAKNYGLLCNSLEKYLSSKQIRWFLEKFCDLASLGADENLDEDSTNNNSCLSKMDFLTKKQDPQTVLLMCRRHAAYNFPAMVQMASGTQNHLIKELLLPQFKKLCQDSETDVRIRIAAGFHEFARRLGDDAPLLIDSFVDLVYSGEPEVISALTAHLTQTLECIYGARRNTASATTDDNGNVVQQPSASFTQLTRILLACNRLIRNGSNWRCHEQLLSAFACLSQFITNDELCQSFLPMIKEEVVNTRSVPCRVAALRTLVKWTHDLKRPADVNSIINYCTQTLANNRSCHKRVLFLDACEMFIEYFSKQFFKENLFDAALKMVNDPVLNIRLRCCKLLPLFKSTLAPSADFERLSALENAVKTLLNTDNQGYTGEVVKKVINELAHADAVDNVITAAHSRSSISPPSDKQSKPAAKKKAEVVPMQISVESSIENGARDTEKFSFESSKDNSDGRPKASALSSNYEEKKISKISESSDEKSKRSTRSPSPPTSRFGATEKSPFSSTSLSTTKKTAIVQPRQLINRSPSPRPPLSQYVSSYQKELPSKIASSSTARNYASSSSQNESNGDTSSYKSRPPKPSATSSSLTSSSSYNTSLGTGRQSETSETLGRNSLMKSASSSSVGLDKSSIANERIVPIRMLESSSLSTANLRPPTPVTGRRTSRDSGSSYESPLARSSSTTSANLASSLPISSTRRTSVTSQVRNIPVIRTGTVSQSIERFEPGPTTTSKRTDNDSTLTRRLSNTTTDSGLGYSRNMNRSFSSFSRDSALSTDSNNNTNSRISSIDSRKDYSLPSRRSTYSSTLSDRSPYSLTKVRSGSSLARR